MKKFSRSRLLLIGILGAVIGSQLWRRRKLSRLARRIELESQLLQTAIRITHEVRGRVDIQQMLDTTAEEIARALNVTHCFLDVYVDEKNARLRTCSCQTDHGANSLLTKAFAETRHSLLHEKFGRFVVHDQPGPFSVKEAVPVMGVPIVSPRRIPIGCVLVSSESTRVWLESEVQLLLAVAHQLSLSVTHARLFVTREQQAFTDSLTGCLNRRAFDVELMAEVDVAKEKETPLSLIMLDLDYFKRLNDTHGHTIGDEALRLTGKILLEDVENTGLAARYGGEEFALILPNCSLPEALRFAERIRQRVERARLLDLTTNITVSLGVAAFPLNAPSAESLIMKADLALYQAKGSGRNCVRSA